MKKSIASTIMLFLLGCTALCFAQTSVGQEEQARGSLRERLKQHWLQREQNMPAPATDADDGARINKPGDYTFSLLHDGLTRMFKVHVPVAYTSATSVPLLVAMHGGGGDMHYQANDRYYGLISKSDKEGFIVVFPNGFSKLKSGKFATWNAGACCGGARDGNIDDVGFIRRMIARLSNQLQIDRNRIFATGMSNGGMMAYRLACEMPDMFKAIASVAGTDATTTCHPKAAISILHIHASDDDHVLFNGGSGRSLGNKSAVMDFTSVPQTMSKWVKLNHCSPKPARILEKPGAYCDAYSDCDGKTEVMLCVTATGGHSWPGGVKPRGGESASTAISADDVMWDFFKTR